MKTHRLSTLPSLIRAWVGVAALAGATAAQGSCAAGASVESGPQSLEALKRDGKQASMTVLPVGLAGQPSPQVGEVVGLLLERGGMTHLVVEAPAFRPPADADLAATATALGEFVKANPISTDYALYVDVRGTVEKGCDEVRTFVAGKGGEAVWQDRQTRQDDDFRRLQPREPLQFALLAVERLRPVLALDDPTQSGAPEGKLAASWGAKTGVPTDAERAAMEARAATFARTAPSARLAVFAPLIDDRVGAAEAADLAKAIGEAHLAHAAAAPGQPKLEVKPAMNEQKMLWDLARAFRDWVKANPPDADYALYPHYLGVKNGRVGAVHFVVCDRQGEWVVVDYQNDHHADFGAVDPKNPADCNRLLVRRLQGYVTSR
jgi:hypothetical protein